MYVYVNFLSYDFQICVMHLDTFIYARARACALLQVDIHTQTFSLEPRAYEEGGEVGAAIVAPLLLLTHKD